MKNKKILLLSLLLVLCFVLAAASCDCGGNNDEPDVNNPQQEQTITLNGFDGIPAEINCYYGSSVQITLPIVIDSIGNVVDVYYTVKASDGSEVALEAGRFFAMDDKGYTVDYTVKTADGKTHDVHQSVKVVKKIQAENAVLVDVGTKTTIDIVDVLPEDHRNTVNALKDSASTKMQLLKEYSDQVIDVTSTQLDMQNVEKCAYMFSIKAPMGSDMVYSDVYSCEIDFYNSADGMEWVNNSALNIENAHAKLENMTEAIAKDNLPEGAVASEYFYITDDTDPSGNYIMAISAIHSKAYYEMWKEEGATHLLYDVYLNKTNNDAKWYFAQDKSMKAFWFYFDQWNTVEIPIDTLLDYYADYGNDGAISFNYGNMLQSGEYSYAVQMYIGNFRGRIVDKTLDTTVNLADVADVSDSFDYISMLRENGKTSAVETLSKYDASDVTWTIDGETISDVSTLRGIHDVVATNGEKKLYSGTIDFYNSDDGIEWVENNSLSLDNAYTKIAGMTKEIKSANLPVGAIASQYYYITDGKNGASTDFVFSIGAIHSKAYYEMWKEKGVTSIAFDVYYESSSNFYFSNMDKYPYEDENGNYVEKLFWVNANGWQTVELSIDNVIKNFDYMTSSEHASSVFNMLQARETFFVCELYVGNFRGKIIDKNLDETINLADVKGDFDFVSMLTKNGKTSAAETLSRYDASDVVWTIDGEEASNLSTLRGVHEISATYKGMKLYSGTADFYNRDDGMVWVENNNLSLDNAHVKVDGMTKEIKSGENLPEGATASQYYYITNTQTESKILAFAISATHSKEYYQMWKDGGVESLLIDCYETTTGGYFRNFEKGETAFNTTKNGWYKLEFSLEKLLSTLNAEKGTTYFDGLATDNATYLCNMLCEGEAAEVKIFVGNFRGKTATVTDPVGE